jgi:uncharacterized membrane protein
MMDMMNGGNGWWWMGGYMWLFSILFWILIIAGVVQALISHHPSSTAADASDLTRRSPSSRLDVVQTTPSPSSSPSTPSDRRLDALATKCGEKCGLVRWLMGKGSQASAPPTESALEILKKRYARGDIDRETFERMKRDIEGEHS